MVLLNVAEVSKTYGERNVVDRVSFAVEAGRCLALLGPSGSGKSTLLNLIAGFDRPDCGDIQIRGDSILRLPPHRRKVGIVFQQYALFPHLSVAENVAYSLVRQAVPAAERERRVARLLASVQLDAYAAQSVQTLSGGQQQRVAIARALAAAPDILLMDEPMGALDRTLRDELQVELKSLLRQSGITVVYVTHDQREAIALAEEIAVLHAGRIQQVGATEAIFAAPDNAFVASFLWPGANRLRGVIEQIRGSEVTLRLGRAQDGSKVDALVRGQWREAHTTPRLGLPAELLLRPRDLQLTSTDAAVDDALPAVVVETIFSGESRTVQLQLPNDERITTQQPLDALWQRGESVAVRWRPERAFAYAPLEGPAA